MACWSPAADSWSLASPCRPPATSGFNPLRRVQRQLRAPTQGPREPSASAWTRDSTTRGCLSPRPWPQLRSSYPAVRPRQHSGRQVPGANIRGVSSPNATIASEAPQFQVPHCLVSDLRGIPSDRHRYPQFTGTQEEGLSISIGRRNKRFKARSFGC